MAGWPDVPGVVELPDGRRVRGTGLRNRRPDVPTGDFAVYLLPKDPRVVDVEYRWVRWLDFWLPRSTTEAVAALGEAHTRAATERVEIGCGGGVGRTGTAIALLAVMAGAAPEDSVIWVRQHYHRRAVETVWQRHWISRAAALLDV